jgi:hypothetical protein
MKAIIEKKVRFIDTNEDFIEVETTIYFFKLPIFWKSKKIVPPLDDNEMSQTKRLYKSRETGIIFGN